MSPLINVLISDDDTERALTNYSVDSSCVKLSFKEPKVNVENDLSHIEELLGHELHPLVLDFYNIALAVYMADLQVAKIKKTYCRNIAVLISVSDINKWNSVKQKLEATLRFLSGDNFKFYFVQSSRASVPFKFEAKDKRAVTLFSGGLDSLSGIEWLHERNLEPVLVSHASKNTIFKVQTIIAQKIDKVFGKSILFGQIAARPKQGAGLSAKEYTEPCRSFLYFTLGIMFALELGIRQMFVFENGVMALNVPITTSRIYLSTRTTHPIFMTNYSDLVSAIFNTPLSIENPFMTLTKGEVVQHLENSNLKDAIKDSYSCSSDRHRYEGIKTTDYPHCGKCVPCLIRRISMNKPWAWNIDSKYAYDICNDYKNFPREGTNLLFEMLDFGHRLENCKTDDEAIMEFPQFLVEGYDPSPFIDMYRRQTAETKEFLRQRADESFKQELTQWL